MSDQPPTELQARLAAHQQEHVLRFWPLLTVVERVALTAQLEKVDLNQLELFFTRTQAPTDQQAVDSGMVPIARSMVGNAKEFPPSAEMLAWEERGLKLIADNKVAALLLAGGMGTRLGSSQPKGMFPLELPSGSTLFHIQAHRIRRVQQRAQEVTGRTGIIPWYIMTSGATMEATEDFFKDNDYFGLDPRHIFFFEQGQIPALTFDGKLILETKSSLSLSPNGNGGLYGALQSEGALDDMIKRGIQYIHTYCVDNILVKVADPVFVGYADEVGVGCAAKVVPKESPHEKVGVVCKVGGQFKVVEYSEISNVTAERRSEDGSLMFNAGNICNHLFSIDFLKNCCDRHLALQHHVARKCIKYCDDQGNALVTPPSENGIKLELFVFDVFEFADRLALMEVKREHEFSPLKNKKVKDGDKGTAESCRTDLYNLNRNYLQHAGVEVDASTFVEISPLVSYRGEGLDAKRIKTTTNLEANPIVIS